MLIDKTSYHPIKEFEIKCARKPIDNPMGSAYTYAIYMTTKNKKNKPRLQR